MVWLCSTGCVCVGSQMAFRQNKRTEQLTGVLVSYIVFYTQDALHYACNTNTMLTVNLPTYAKK